MPEALCGERLRTLAQTLADLRCRKGELTAQLDDEPTDTYDDLDPTELEGLVADILTHDDENDLPATKALFQQLIENVEVDGRHAVRPTFRVPSLMPAVRNLSGLVVLACHYANTLAAVQAPVIVLSAPNSVLRRGHGDR